MFDYFEIYDNDYIDNFISVSRSKFFDYKKGSNSALEYLSFICNELDLLQNLYILDNSVFNRLISFRSESIKYLGGSSND